MKPTKRNLKFLFHESNKIEGFDGRPDMDEQQMVAWDYLLEACPQLRDIGHKDVMKVQKILTLRQPEMRPDWRGYYRKIPVWIGGRKLNNFGVIPAEMAEWLRTLPDSDPVKHHIAFEHIHPFVDGNGRTGRMFMWFMQYKRGELLTNVNYEKRWDYYEWFR